MHPSLENRASLREIALRSGLIFVFLLILALVVAVVLYFNERRVQTALLVSSQRQRLAGLREIVASDLQAVAADVMILAKGKTLAAFLATESPAARANLAEEFQLFASQNDLYDQIRYIRDDGQEVVRVNLRQGKAEVVRDPDLQSKIGRYYFQETLALSHDEIYISPFDLNVENGQIEEPPKPTIRLGTPAFDASGAKRGVVVVNYLGRQLLAKLDGHASGEPGHIMLLNADGFWLQGGGPQRDWAFMFKGRDSASLARIHPGLWSQMQTARDGQVLDAHGLYSYTTVYPAERLGSALSTPASAQDYRWLLVAHVSPQQLAAESNRVLSSILGMLSGAALLLAVVSWLLGRSLVMQRHSARRLAEQQRLAAIGTAMAALAHESRNTLQRSQAGLEMLARRLPPGEETQQLFDEVQDAQYHLHDLYEHARDWASPRQPQPEAVDLGQLATTVWEHLAHERAGRNDSLQIESIPGPVIGHVDRRMFSQVLRNIFENSLAAANPAHVRVQCTFDDAIRVAIADNGPGLDAEQARRIFEPFFTTRMRGTGLGMAISRRIVAAHGGTITAHNVNTVDRPTGTEVVIDLPRAQT